MEGVIGSCWGLIAGYGCGRGVDAEGSFGGGFAHSNQNLDELIDDEKSHSLTVEWSYSTNSEPQYAGKMSGELIQLL